MPFLHPLRFTEEDAIRANNEWGANCGPGAIAAILGKTLDEVRPYLGDFEKKRYTNPTLMFETLTRLNVLWWTKPKKNHVVPWPEHGLARIQWEGPWTAPLAPPKWAYRQTHWVASHRREGDGSLGIFDINAMNSSGWVLFGDWRNVIVPHILKTCVPRATGGYFLTHAIEIEPAAPSVSEAR